MTFPRSSLPLVPAWLSYSLLSTLLFGLWGIQSKIVVEQMSPLANQVLATPGLLAVAFLLLLRRRLRVYRTGPDRRLGIFFAFLTGIFGATGNVAFFEALRYGQASVVVPLTALYPTVTVLLAVLLLKETMNRWQTLGLILAIASIIILGS